ncbi:MAG: DnaB-like helicase N-terminal domain-containing protein, partial [Nitrospinota bacterium]
MKIQQAVEKPYGKESKMPLLPHNIEIEQSLLGSILINNDAIMQAVETLSGSSDFYQPIHRIIYDAMLKLFEQNEPIDLLTLSNILKKVGKVSVDDAYLAELNLAPPSATNAQIYAKIIHNKAMLRNLIKVSNDVASLAYEDREDVGYVIDKAESMIFDIAQNKVKKSFNPISTIIKQGVELVEQLYERKELITGVPTGYKDLDEKTSGLQPSDLIIIAGRPSMGKTAFALNIAQNFSLAEPEAVIAIFSLEMSNAQL